MSLPVRSSVDPIRQSERTLFRVHPSSPADLCHINSVQLVKCLDKPPEAIVKELEFASSEIELVVVSVKPCVYDMFLRSAPAGARPRPPKMGDSVPTDNCN